MMADGTTKPIKDIKIGDKVLASDPRSRTLEAQNVTALHVNLDVGLIDLVVAAADGTVATIHTTSHHLFWDDTVEAWVPAAGLEAGHRLRAPTSGAHVVVAIKKVAGTRVMLDLTVDNLHTYYVVAGGTPILVHNDGEVPGNTRRIFNIAGEYNGRIDRFPYRGQAHFEIHVFYGQTEVGIFGSNGWIGKHGHPADMRLWSAVENRLKGVAIAEMKRSGRLPLDANVKDDAWKRPHVDGGC